jgi:citrate lyase synthetase
MLELLPLCGVKAVQIVRLAHGQNPISASRVRALLKERAFEEIGRQVPLTTLRYLVMNASGKVWGHDAV